MEVDHDTRVLIRRALEEAEYFVVSTTNGAEGLTLLEKISTPSVILLSMELYPMTVEQFLNVLKNEPKYAAIPVVRIQKPLKMNELLKAISTA